MIANSEDKMKAAILIQRKIRSNMNDINNYTTNYKKIKVRIINILDRIQNNYEIGILNQDRYYILMGSTEDILTDFNVLPHNIQLQEIYKYDIVQLQISIYMIKEKIIQLVCCSGSSSLFDMLDLIIGDEWISCLSENIVKYIHFLNKVFIPTGCKIIEKNEEEEDKIKIKNMDLINATLVEKIDGASIDIPFTTKKLNIIGYFKKDPLNIHKDYSILSRKYVEMISRGNSIEISNNFIERYLNQMTTRDLVVLSVEKIIKKIQRDYDHLSKLKTQLLSSLVKEFLMSNMQDQRKILTLFLLEEENETQHLAYLMYDMISTSSDSLKPQFMAEEIYKSLHWSVQKLFKIAFKNVENYRSSLLNLTEDDIPYEDRIVQMKASDSIKSKALEKLKETTRTKDSTKAQHYLDGILKIPFGIYKKEKILSFLDDYSKNINVLFEDINKNEFELIKEVSLYKTKLCNYQNNNTFITENQLDDLISYVETILEEVNIEISKNELLDKVKQQVDIYHLEEKNSLEKLENIKKIKEDIDDCDDSDILKKMELDIEENIKLELEKFRNTLYGLPTSPKLLKMQQMKLEDKSNEVECSLDVEEPEIDNNLIEEYKNWLSIESQLMSLINEWIKYKHSKKEYMTQVRSTLDNCIYGQLDAKKHIERLIAQWINGKMEGNVFGFLGPPGVGKTTLCKKGLAKCLVDENGESRPFAFIPLGGSTNGSVLEGHGYTYVGSTWGKIVDVLMETKCMNPVIYIDELDKISRTEHGRELVGILTHLTDPSQNSEFTDRFFSGIKLDLSKTMIVFSYNDASLIDGILRDRITEVEVKSITKKEKMHIVKEYLLPEILDSVGYTKGDFIIEDNEIDYIIENYTYEAGVRKLKERLFELIRHINLIKVLDTEPIVLPYTITEEFIKKQFSDRPKVQYKKIAKDPQIGLVNGLYATSAGTGGITIIEVMKTPSDTKLSLELTGNQGDVMKESMKCAKTIAWNLLPYDIKKETKKVWDETGSFGLHIHCPEASTPKDGPSAGAAITLAILSRLCNCAIKNTIAMTGEIDLNGQIHQIGGLESKLDGAKRAGVSKVLIPKDNVDDYNRIVENMNDSEREIYINGLEIVAVSSIEDVLRESFVENDLTFCFN